MKRHTVEFPLHSSIQHFNISTIRTLTKNNEKEVNLKCFDQEVLLTKAMTVFTHVVITAPSGEAIQCYEEQLRALNLDCVCITCADPDGCRIGSGGGTLNALDHVDQLIGREALLKSRVLVVHSGGDSRRAPLLSVCGKVRTT